MPNNATILAVEHKVDGKVERYVVKVLFSCGFVARFPVSDPKVAGQLIGDRVGLTVVADGVPLVLPKAPEGRPVEVPDDTPDPLDAWGWKQAAPRFVDWATSPIAGPLSAPEGFPTVSFEHPTLGQWGVDTTKDGAPEFWTRLHRGPWARDPEITLLAEHRAYLEAWARVISMGVMLGGVEPDGVHYERRRMGKNTRRYRVRRADDGGFVVERKNAKGEWSNRRRVIGAALYIEHARYLLEERDGK